ncbi:MAG TPA: hypothetical protein VNT75_23965, partial [Symbiobacteriaceae bacterium]|nr:hypothetical protein [Symbiobacteriaceae bacterium]
MRKGWDLWGDLAAVGAATWMGLHVLRTFAGQLGFIVGAALTFNLTVGLLFGVWALGIAAAILLHRLGAQRLGWGFAAVYVVGYVVAAPGVTQVFA